MKTARDLALGLLACAAVIAIGVGAYLAAAAVTNWINGY